MPSYCEIGDSPTVYYKFFGQSKYAKVSFNMAPIAIELEDLSNSGSGSDDGSDSDDDDNSPSPYIPCPPEGTVCRLTATGSFLFAEGEVGDRNSFNAEGWALREEAIAPVNDPDRFDEETGEPYQTLQWRVTATRSYIFRRGTARPSPPTYYEENFGLTDWSTADSCFPNGGDPLTCSDAPPPPPPPPPPPLDNTPPSPETKKKLKIKVLHGTKVIWSQTGEPPLDYEVSCSKSECPPKMTKFKSNNSQGFCCIKCSELQQELSTIKALLRQSNG